VDRQQSPASAGSSAEEPRILFMICSPSRLERTEHHPWFRPRQREVELLGHRPERLVHRVADHLGAVVRVRPQEPAAHPELFA
jgi:hypothetical protein